MFQWEDLICHSIWYKILQHFYVSVCKERFQQIWKAYIVNRDGDFLWHNNLDHYFWFFAIIFGLLALWNHVAPIDSQSNVFYISIFESIFKIILRMSPWTLPNFSAYIWTIRICCFLLLLYFPVFCIRRVFKCL